MDEKKYLSEAELDAVNRECLDELHKIPLDEVLNRFSIWTTQLLSYPNLPPYPEIDSEPHHQRIFDLAHGVWNQLTNNLLDYAIVIGEKQQKAEEEGKDLFMNLTRTEQVMFMIMSEESQWRPQFDSTYIPVLLDTLECLFRTVIIQHFESSLEKTVIPYLQQFEEKQLFSYFKEAFNKGGTFGEVITTILANFPPLKRKKFLPLIFETYFRRTWLKYYAGGFYENIDFNVFKGMIRYDLVPFIPRIKEELIKHPDNTYLVWLYNDIILDPVKDDSYPDFIFQIVQKFSSQLLTEGQKSFLLSACSALKNFPTLPLPLLALFEKFAQNKDLVAETTELDGNLLYELNHTINNSSNLK